MLKQFPRPTIFAHRGSSAHAPENTIAAFRLAIEHGADAIELDAKLAADGHVVVIHDQTVDRTTPAQGRVSEMTTYELSRLDAGSHFDCAYSGEGIPTLEDVFYTVGKKILINIELTNYSSPMDDLPQKAAQLVQQGHLQNHVLFSSFNPIALFRIRKILPEVPIGLLALHGRSGWWARAWIGELLNYQSLHPEFNDVHAKLVQRVHKKKKRLHVYTVNQPDDIQKLLFMQVDGIFTDDPLLARRCVPTERNIKKNDPL